MYRIITLYNNKGGVSKTTTAFNLGVFLTLELNKKILLVDCDPQSNLTELFFASNASLDDPSIQLPGTSLYQALRPRFYGDQGRIDAKSIQLTPSSLYEKLYILRGDFELGMAETYFGQACAQAITENVNEKQTYLVLHRLFNDLRKTHSFDHIIIDVGPSVGALTRLAVISCDAFFMPTSPDRFCNQAISVLGNVLADWTRRHNNICETFEPFGLETFSGSPVFLGAISQNFKAWAGKAKRSYRHWQNAIAETIKKTFLIYKVILRRDEVAKQPFVAEIKDVGPIAPVAQIFGRAIFDVQQEHTSEASTSGQQYYGVVWKNWEKRMSEYKSEMKKIAEVVL